MISDSTRVHPGADVLERGEVGEPPVAEPDRHLGEQVGRAGDIDVGGRAEASTRASRSAARTREPSGPGASRLATRLPAPVGLGRQQDLVVGVGDHDLDAGPAPALLVQAEIDGDDDDAEHLVVQHHLARVVEAVAAVVVLDDREDRAGVGHGLGEVAPCRRRTARAGRSSLAATIRPPASSRKIEPAPISSRKLAQPLLGAGVLRPSAARAIRIGSRDSSSGTTEWRCIVLWIAPA